MLSLFLTVLLCALPGLLIAGAAIFLLYCAERATEPEIRFTSYDRE
jgi:hypothetical protein